MRSHTLADIFLPIMLIHKPQHLPDLPVTQRRLSLPQLPLNFHTGTLFFQKLLRGAPLQINGDEAIRRIEHLKPQPALLDPKVANLAQVARVNVRPGVALPRCRVGDERREIASVLVRLNDVADAECVDVRLEAARKGACRLLVAHLGEGVSCHFCQLPLRGEPAQETCMSRREMAYESSGSMS